MGDSSLLGFKHNIYSHTCDLKSNRDRRNSGNCNFKSLLYELTLGSNVDIQTRKCVCNQSTFIINKVSVITVLKLIWLFQPLDQFLHLEGPKKHSSYFFSIVHAYCQVTSVWFSAIPFSARKSLWKSLMYSKHILTVWEILDFSYTLIKCHM